MRASRLLSIQMLLETRGRMSATELAGLLEVSVRTLYRDIDELTSAGVPVYAERGRAGGFQLLPGWKTTLTGLTPTEAEAVFLSGLAGPAAELGLGAEVQSAQLKLLSALPAQWRGHARRISSRLHLDPVEWYREADTLAHLSTVAKAVWEERQLGIAYTSWTRSARQVVHPLGLVLKAGTWYLVATREGKLRTFRVAGITDARALEARCTRPRRFDLARHWAESVQRFETELYAAAATVTATAAGLADLRQWNATVARALRGVANPAAGQRVEVRIPIESVLQAAGPLLRLAPDVEVQAPRELRAAILARAQAAARMYARRKGN
ncbi:WYL domain-containing protein [Ramlibacter sp. G-1-2-2]|uniref:WYL domain-containing protein n=1 Tax=Ramlibacter agri TaxID=2728837 RepID=A0A848H497_9BURK|nr:WYL domain-containing protein [Ramlibacter agri]NML44050.1 WYL domain-containing protein [Ramlibacter agri]